MIPKRYYLKTIKVLSIGNSFSQDAQRYLYGIARADGIEIKAVNLYIGGCSLSKHCRNILSEDDVYSFEINGICNTGIKVSMKEALLSDDWDYITIQQQSLESCDYDTFTPYLEILNEYVRRHCPKAKILLLKTWGYKNGSEKLEKAGYSSNREMFEDIEKAYAKAKERISAKRIIPLGNAVAMAAEMGAENIYRDEFHMSMGFGRYLLGLVFYGSLVGRPVDINPFCDFDKDISDEDVALAKKIATEVLKK
ncbi:MAG: DUF4886 domain-containing protein [Clostridia bacterium]|nr:DUF4886 domain-containing protein [Clostridia bacterium]